MTQAEASLALGTNSTQLYRYESGAREAPLSFVHRAERVYEQLIAATIQPSGVSRGTVRSGAPTDTPASAEDHYRRALLKAAQTLTTLAAEMIREANQGAAR